MSSPTQVPFVAWASNSGPQPVWVADFSTGTLGDFGSLPGGLSFQRSGGGRSVQTSASTIMLEAGKSFASSNNPRGGQVRGSASRGLSLLGATENNISDNNYADASNASSDVRDVSNATVFALAGSGETYSGGTGSPDGVATAKRVQVTSGGYGKYRVQLNAKGTSAANAPFGALTLSTWQKSSGVVQQAFGVFDGVNNPYFATADTLSGSWSRLATTHPAIGAAYKTQREIIPVYGAAGNSGGVSGGVAATAIDCEVDLLQVEAGMHPTDWCAPGAGGTRSRAAEGLYIGTSTGQIFSGRLCLEITCIPYGAATEYAYQVEYGGGGGLAVATEIHLWYMDASNRGWFDPATRKITSRVNAVDYVHNTALSWTRLQMLQIWIEVGNGTPRASYRVSTNDGTSWGAATALGTGASQAALPGSGAIDFLCRRASFDVFNALVCKLRAFDNKRPTWVV